MKIKKRKTIQKMITLIFVVTALVLSPSFITNAAQTTLNTNDVIIINENEDIEKYLVDKGYEIVNGNIKVNECGEYQIKCRKQGEVSLKKVIVKKHSTNFVSSVISNEVTMAKTSNTIIKSTYEDGDNAYILYDMYYNNDGYTRISANITKTKKGVYDRDYHLYSSKQVDYRDLYVDGANNIILYCGSRDNTRNGNIEAAICGMPYGKYDSSKIISYDLEGDGEEKLNTICKAHDYYYFGGYTSSKTGFFEHEKRTNKDPVIIKMDSKTCEIVDVKTFDEDFKLSKNEEIVKIINYDNYLYGLIEVDKHQYSIIKMDYFGNLIDKRDYNSFLYATVLKMAVFNEKIYLLFEYYDYSLQRRIQSLKELLPDLSLKEIDTFKEKNVKAVDFRMNDIGEVTYLVMDNTSSNYYLEQRNGEVTNYQTDIVTNITQAVFCSQTKNLIASSLSNTNIALDCVQTFFQKEEEVWMNDKKITPIIVTENEVDENLFGNYDSTYIYQLQEINSFSYVMAKMIVVPPSFGVENEEEYDVGLKLYFNGEALLNNMRIEQGHIITLPGEYTMTLNGFKGATQSLRFKVSNLAVSKKVDEHEHIKNVDIVIPNERSNNEKIDLQFVGNTYTPKNKIKLAWLYVVPAAAFVLSIVIGIRKDFIK